MIDASFLSRPLRRVAALIATVIALVSGGAYAETRLRATAIEESEKALQPLRRDVTHTREIVNERLAELLRRLDRIERKLDR